MQIPKDLKAHPENILILNIPANREGEVYQGYILTASLELNKYRAIYPNPLPVKTSEFPFETNPETCIENCIVGDRIQYNKEMQAMHSAIPYQTYMLYATMGVYLPHRNVIVSAFGSLNLRDIYFKLKSHGLTQDDISGLTWQGLYSIAEDWVKLHQTAQTAAQSTNAAQTDREYSPKDKEPQKRRTTEQVKQANRKIKEAIRKFGGTGIKPNLDDIAREVKSLSGVPKHKLDDAIRFSDAWKEAKRKGEVVNRRAKGFYTPSVAPNEHINDHSGGGQSALNELAKNNPQEEIELLELIAEYKENFEPPFKIK